MSNEWIRGLLDGLWDKLKLIFDRALNAPEIIQAWSEGRASTGDKVALIVALVLIVAAVAWVVNFFKAGFWKKLGMLASAALVIFAAAIALSFFSTAEELPAPEPPLLPAGSAAPLQPQNADGPETPSDTPAPVQSAPRRGSNGQYSLARGAADPVYGSVNAMWRIIDDAVSWQLSDTLVLQLNRLQSLPGTGRFAVEEMVNYGDRAVVTLRSFEGSGIGNTYRRSECVLEITVWPGAKLTRMPWYAEAPSYVASGEQESYSIFANTASEVQFWEKKASVTNENGDVVTALCLGRQIESDVVLVTARAFTSVTEEGHVEYTDFNPDPDGELRRRLGELESAVFDGRIRLLRGLSDDSIVSVLPGKLVDFPVGEGSGRGGFTLPCARLLEMRRSDAYGSIIRLIGPGPNGEEMLYSLVDGAALYEYALTGTDRYFTWRAGYEDGWLTPDEKMTAFLGCPAVACDGGWVIDAGGFYSPSAGAEMENYYFLGVEVRTPAPTPAPTEAPAENSEGGPENG